MAVLADLQRVAVIGADRSLFEELSLTVSDGDRIGIVGINGTGKSTLLRVIAGLQPPDQGDVRRGRGVRVGFLDQVPLLSEGTVAQAVGAGWESEAALDRLGMGTELETAVTALSGGQAKRVALAQVLAQPAELLILDEPTNHLDLRTVTWLERRLTEHRGGLVIVSHDRYLLDRVTTKMIELDRGRGYLHDGGYSSYLEAKATREEQAASQESKRKNLARRELAWLRRGAKARSTKPQARLQAARTLLSTEAEGADRPDDLEITIDMPRLGDTVIEARNASFAFGPTTVLSNVEVVLGPGDRIGIVGANGTGKSTLLNLLAERITPASGTVVRGTTVEIGYYDQQGADLDLDARVQDLVAGPHKTPGSLADVALMKRFWFTGSLPFSRVGDLSGGERRRLQLLMVIAQRPNVLFLDEPTNDLDLETLRIVEDFLEDFTGTLVVVSHDRAFIERTTDHLLAIEADGTVSKVAGGVAGWIARESQASPRQAPPGASPSAPTRSQPTHAAAKPSPQPSAGPKGRRLREAEKEMERLAKQRDRLTEVVLATSDHVELKRLGDELSGIQLALADAEDAWLELAAGDA